MIIPAETTGNTDSPYSLQSIRTAVSNSELTMWRRCRRKWWLSYYRRLTLRVVDYSSVMRKGDRLHRVLAEWYQPTHEADFDIFAYQNQVIGEDRAAVEETARHITEHREDDDVAQITASALESYDKDVQLERIMLEGYLQWLQEIGADSDYRVLQAEVPVCVPVQQAPIDVSYLSNGVLQRRTACVSALGIMDAQVEDVNSGLRYLIDHKTVGSFGETVRLLGINTQIAHYLMMERLQYGTRSAGVIYNMLRRVKRTASAKPPFYERHLVQHNDYVLETYRRQLLSTAHDMLIAGFLLSDGYAHQEIVYPTPCAQCSWDCPFFVVCGMLNDSSADAGAQDFLTTYYQQCDPLERYRNAGLLQL